MPELKKLLNERGLTQTGNKADLIARLQENDKEKDKTSGADAAGKRLSSAPPPTFSAPGHRSKLEGSI